MRGFRQFEKARMNSHIVVHYGEIGTKGNNRAVFETQLRKNVEAALEGLRVARTEKMNQRFLVEIREADLGEARLRLAKTFGIAWFAEARVSSLSYESIKEEAVSLTRSRPAGTFAISSRRANKGFPMSSHELSVRLGDDVRKDTGKEVDLSHPDLTLHVDVLDDRAVVYSKKEQGPGGLPVGVSGRVMHLLSGGIDSPVAAYLMMKRGCEPVYVHFYVAPDPKLVLETKIPRLVRTLARYSSSPTLVLLPFSPYQVATTGVPSENEPVLFRVFMRMVAERLAPRFHADGVSSGDNLAQVASQTLQNLNCIDKGSRLSALRPLLTYDKSEIVELSMRIGTYEDSIEPYKDCCSIISSHPRTRLRARVVEMYSKELDFERLADETISMEHTVTLDSEGRPAGARTAQEAATSARQ